MDGTEVSSGLSTFDVVWARIVRLAGETFVTKTGKQFSYTADRAAVHLATTSRSLPRSGFSTALSRFPISGPGALQDLQGPSYIYAILTDPRVSPTALTPLSREPREPAVSPSAPRHTSRPMHRRTTRPGCPVAEETLASRGFVRHELAFEESVELSIGTGRNWNTLGDIPQGPGLYAFTAENPTSQRPLAVYYVGLTSDLWMVTKGQLPGGVARGGQRYGRPKHAGATRQRVNVEIAALLAEGCVVSHWLNPVRIPPDADTRTWLRHEEEKLITEWNLRSCGWNRG